MFDMSAPYIWGDLDRATNDNTKIDEAIGEAITAHNDDPTAHLGADQSLQSHRASEIIDHLAESVVNDKMRFNARAYRAIVDPSSDVDFDTIKSAVDYARENGGGAVLVMPGTHYIADTVWLDERTTLVSLDRDNTRILNNGNVASLFGKIESSTVLTPLASPLSYTNGSKNVTITLPEYRTLANYVGCVVFDVANNRQLAGYIASVSSGTTATMSVNQSATATTSNAYVSPQFTVTNGSKTATIANGASVAACSVHAGGRIKLSGSSTDFIVSTIQSDTVITLDTNWTGVSGTYRCVPGAGLDGAISFDELSITNTFGDFLRDDAALSSAPVSGEVVVTSSNINLAGFFLPGWNTTYKVDDCYIACTGMSGGQIPGRAIANNCTFIFDSDYGGFGYTSGVQRITNCDISSTHTGGSDIFNGSEGGTFIIGNSISNISASGIYMDRGLVANNKFSNNGTRQLYIDGGNINLTGNECPRITLRGKYIVATGNLTDVAITNSGTGNTLAGNGVY